MFNRNEKKDDQKMARFKLMNAIFDSDLGGAVTALNSGADPNQKIHETPLHIACRFGCTDIAELLIMRGASTETIDLIGATPLFYAKEGCVKLLLEQKANPNAQLNDWESVLKISVMQNNRDKVKLLLEHQADLNMKGVGGQDALDVATGDILELIKNCPKKFKLKRKV